VNHSTDPVDIAVGVIRDPAGRVLINRRPAGKPLAGLWEFPGGKTEPGETIAQALKRELAEELGITVSRQRPLIAFNHDFGEWRVRLHVHEVLDYEGEVADREAQALRWMAPQDLGTVELLPANAPIVRAVHLPRVCLITDLERYGADRTLARLAGHAARQRVLLLVREKQLARARLASFVDRAGRVLRSNDSLVVVHADCDLRDCEDFDGIHLPARVLQSTGTPPATGLVGASCHSEAELASALQRRCDYALLSPVKPTSSHPSASTLGWTGFSRLCRDLAMPVYALGGLDWSALETAANHGAQGVAMLSAAWE